jgi:branched-chain amino acid transport system substrate-binding protein
MLLVSLLILVLAGAVTWGLVALGGPSPPISIGVIYNTSGGLKWLDDPGLNGLLLAAEQINDEGGVLGRQIEVVAGDGTTDVVKMTDVASQLTARDDIVALAGINEPLHAVAPVRATIKRADGGFLTFSHSETALAVGEVAQAAGVPFVTAGSTRGSLPEVVGDEAFMVAAPHEDGATAIARYAWDDLGGREAWVLVDERSDYAKGLAAAFEEAWTGLGGGLTGDGYTPGAVIQIPDQIERLESQTTTPDVIFIASMPNDGGYLLDQLREAGIDQPVLFADVVDPRYIEAMGGDMRDVHMATHGSIEDPDDDMQAFVDAYSEEHGTAPESATAMLGYDTMRLIAEAIERAGSTSHEAVTGSLAETSDFAALTGTLTYPDGHTPSKPITIVAYEGGEPEVVAEITIR